MIIDHIGNMHLYQNLGHRISTGLRFLADLSPNGFSERREEIEGASLYAILLSYQTRPDDTLPFEAHDRYIDIQFVACGAELIRIAPRNQLAGHTPYNEADDVALYNPGESTNIVLRAGRFAIIFPHEAHLPQLHPGPPSHVQKVVVKVLA